MTKKSEQEVKESEVKAEAKKATIEDCLKNSEATLDCIKELTKTVAELVSEWKKWSAAGKF